MSDQNRWSEARFRREYEDDDRRWQRRDEDDDRRPEDRDPRELGRDEGYRRASRGYGNVDESRREERSAYSRPLGPSEREGYAEESRGRGYGSAGGPDYGGPRYRNQRSSQGYASQRHAGVGYSGLGGHHSGNQDYGDQDYGNQDHGTDERYRTVPSYIGQRYGNLSGNQDYGDQQRTGDYGRSGYRAAQYGAFGSAESGRQAREWQERGRGASSQQSEGWRHGEHRGKGPKGYTRSDERIREDVCDCLSDDDELDASDITVSVKGGEVTLEGSVSDRRAKQRAEDLAEAVSGVKDVDNKLRKNKGMLQEMGDRLAGSQNNERGGHAGSGTKNTPANASM